MSRDVTIFESRSFELTLFDEPPGIYCSGWSRYDFNRAHRFFLPRIDEIPIVFKNFGCDLWIKGTLRLPFDRTIFELPPGRADHPSFSRYVFLCAQHVTSPDLLNECYLNQEQLLDAPPLMIVVHPFIRTDVAAVPAWKAFPPIFIGTGDKRTIKTVFVTGSASWFLDQDFKNYHSIFTLLLPMSIGLINSGCDQRTVVHPSAQLRRSRARSSRPPLYRFTVVKINDAVPPASSNGGTHASPALHWRRGHYRRLQDKVIPVSSALVGRVSNGIVDKAYNARGS